MSGLIALTTDLGSDSAVRGALYGMIWQAMPGARIVDLSHDIPRGDLLAAQVLLEDALPYFPDGTVHMVMINAPGESDPRILAARLGKTLFLGPDSGVITPLLEHAETNRWDIEIYHACREQDLPGDAPDRARYAALAARLAGGEPPSALGERISDPLRIPMPIAEMTSEGWRGQVLSVDNYGNFTCNIRRPHLEGMKRIRVLIGGQVIEGSPAFPETEIPESPFAMLDHNSRLSICMAEGSAAGRLGVKPGDVVEVRQA